MEKKEKELELTDFMIINQNVYSKNKTECFLSLESNEDFFVVMTNYNNNTSSEIRYLSNIDEANEIFEKINEKMINQGWTLK